MKHSLILSGLVAATFLAPTLALGHEAPCPYCSVKITQDTPTQDNEVALKVGRKRIEYKCVFCALAEAKTEHKGDLSIAAPSEKKGEPVMLKRTDDKWSALPATAHFVSRDPLKHKMCDVQARAFTDENAARDYAKANGGDVLTLEQLNARVK